MIDETGAPNHTDLNRVGGDGDDPASPRTTRRRWFWLTAVVSLVFAWTAPPSLALAVCCTAFGWGDFRRAWRLRRADPSRTRGKVCARFAASWGLIKVSLGAAALMFAIVVISAPTGPGAKNGTSPEFEASSSFKAAGWLALAGLVASVFVSTCAVVSALRHGIRVWVGGRENRAKLVVAGAVLTWAAVVGLAVLLVGLIPPDSPRLLLVGVADIFGLPFAILTLLEKGQRVVAKTPTECWGELPAHLLDELEPEGRESFERRRGDSDLFGRAW